MEPKAQVQPAKLVPPAGHAAVVAAKYELPLVLNGCYKAPTCTYPGGHPGPHSCEEV